MATIQVSPSSTITKLPEAVQHMWATTQLQGGLSPWKSQAATTGGANTPAGSASGMMDGMIQSMLLDMIKQALTFEGQDALNIIAALKQLQSTPTPEFTELATQPASLTSAGIPGNFFFDGTTNFYLCVQTSKWVLVSKVV
jgi:hypothetical protein